MQYQVAFEVKPVSHGFGFSVFADTLNNGIYIFRNVINGSVSAHFSTTKLDFPPLAFGLLPSNATIGSWHRVSATVNVRDILISINGVSVLSFSQTSSMFGSFGLGASFRHVGVFQNPSVESLTGDSIYSSEYARSFLP
ncbi:hypothetical protein DL768_011358 [Monosporascus sp. mg162]|nr:hypothetical protein DL768_011358 [Monosporascus sp. mg162]